MKDVFLTSEYILPKTSVKMDTSDAELKWIFDECERLCRLNKKEFGDYNVLIEGAKYNGVWLETQPLGGEMYAKRDLEAGLSNILIFFRYQRRDGRYPGMISCKNVWDRVAAHYDWMQGCFIADPALKMYYHLGKDIEYLKLAYDSIKDFDEYLWRYRDGNGDGCLETWSVWDTGEDNCTLHILGGVDYPRCGGWGKSVPPKDYGDMPFDSPQYMGYSYSCRIALARMASLLRNGEEQKWLDLAEKTRQKAKELLWDDENKSYYNRNKYGKFIRAITQENIKCMHMGIMTQEMADDFIHYHLMNEDEFFTPYPLPCIAINDPYFHYNDEFSNCAEKLRNIDFDSHDIDNNSWSGPTSGLTYQRSIKSLLNYGHHAEQLMIGDRVIALAKKNKVFVQNNHPITGDYSPTSQNGYSPMMLSVLEFISLKQGINISTDEILWTSYTDADFSYTQEYGEHIYTIEKSHGKTAAYINGKKIFDFVGNTRIKTNMRGDILSIFGIEPKSSVIKLNGETDYKLDPNDEIVFQSGKFVTVKKTSFC